MSPEAVTTGIIRKSRLNLSFASHEQCESIAQRLEACLYNTLENYHPPRLSEPVSIQQLTLNLDGLDMSRLEESFQESLQRQLDRYFSRIAGMQSDSGDRKAGHSDAVRETSVNHDWIPVSAQPLWSHVVKSLSRLLVRLRTGASVRHVTHDARKLLDEMSGFTSVPGIPQPVDSVLKSLEVQLKSLIDLAVPAKLKTLPEQSQSQQSKDSIPDVLSNLSLMQCVERLQQSLEQQVIPSHLAEDIEQLPYQKILEKQLQKTDQDILRQDDLLSEQRRSSCVTEQESESETLSEVPKKQLTQSSLSNQDFELLSEALSRFPQHWPVPTMEQRLWAQLNESALSESAAVKLKEWLKGQTSLSSMLRLKRLLDLRRSVNKKEWPSSPVQKARFDSSDASVVDKADSQSTEKSLSSIEPEQVIRRLLQIPELPVKLAADLQAWCDHRHSPGRGNPRRWLMKLIERLKTFCAQIQPEEGDSESLEQSHSEGFRAEPASEVSLSVRDNLDLVSDRLVQPQSAREIKDKDVALILQAFRAELIRAPDLSLPYDWQQAGRRWHKQLTQVTDRIALARIIYHLLMILEHAAWETESLGSWLRPRRKIWRQWLVKLDPAGLYEQSSLLQQQLSIQNAFREQLTEVHRLQRSVDIRGAEAPEVSGSKDQQPSIQGDSREQRTEAHPLQRPTIGESAEQPDLSHQERADLRQQLEDAFEGLQGIRQLLVATLSDPDRSHLSAVQQRVVSQWQKKSIQHPLLPELQESLAEVAGHSDVQKESEPSGDKESDSISISRSNLEPVIKQLSETLQKLEQRSLSQPMTSSGTEQEYLTSDAGLVLLWPHLTRLFSRKGLLQEEGSCFVDESAQLKAMAYLVAATGLDVSSEDVLCITAAILVGLSPDTLLEDLPELSVDEQRALDHLLQSVIGQWQALKSIPPAGLQTLFLQRGGFWEAYGDGWKLTVDDKPQDVLVNALPWPVGMVSLPWLEGILSVHWKRP